MTFFYKKTIEEQCQLPPSKVAVTLSGAFLMAIKALSQVSRFFFQHQVVVHSGACRDG
jgi:hypothetical protein